MHPSPDQSRFLPEFPGLYASSNGRTVTNAAGFEIGWRDDGATPYVAEGYGILLWGENPGEPPKGEDEILRVLKQLRCTIEEDSQYTSDEDGRAVRALEVRLPVEMTAKEGRRFLNALDRWDREFQAAIDEGYVD